MKSIYDMMGRHTYPILREDAPLEHVERFFQVSARGRGRQKRREGLPPSGPPLRVFLLPREVQLPSPIRLAERIKTIPVPPTC